MPVVVVGLNHRTAPIALLERLAVAEEDVPKAIHQLQTCEDVLEAAVLSTCNRIEVYAAVHRFHAGVQDLRNFLSEFRHVAPEDFTDHIYTYHDEAALGHLFRVAAGVDSMVVGESEILGQVRHAFQIAQQEGAVQRLLGRAFSQALHVGKRARTETAIGRNPTSISSAAVELARRTLTSIAGKRVAVIGAGKMGRLAVKALKNAGVVDVTVVNRSEERASELAKAYGVVPEPLKNLPDVLASVDIVLCSTTAPQTVVDRASVESAVAGRSSGDPLFIVDIAVPRDVEPTVAQVEGVVLRDIDDLRGVVESSVGSRLGEVSRVEAIVAAELQRFTEWEKATEIAPTISALLARAETIRDDEMRRAVRRLADLTDEERALFEQTTKRIIAKLLHDPLNKAKGLASSKQGHLYLAALRELFELDDEPES